MFLVKARSYNIVSSFKSLTHHKTYTHDPRSTTDTEAVLSFQQYRVAITEQQRWQVHTFFTQVRGDGSGSEMYSKYKSKKYPSEEHYFKLTEPHVISIQFKVY